MVTRKDDDASHDLVTRCTFFYCKQAKSTPDSKRWRRSQTFARPLPTMKNVTHANTPRNLGFRFSLTKQSAVRKCYYSDVDYLRKCGTTPYGSNTQLLMENGQ